MLPKPYTKFDNNSLFANYERLQDQISKNEPSLS